MKLTDVYQGGRVAPGAIDFLYALLQERPAEANISHSAMPTIEQHRQFVHRRPYRCWYIIENGEGERVGALYATELNEVGVAILQAHQRRGYALRALTEFLASHPALEAIPARRPSRYVAHVAPTNEASKALFEHLGGKQIQVTYGL